MRPIVATLLLASFWTSAALAQTSDFKSTAESKARDAELAAGDRPVKASFSIYGEHNFSSDFKDTTGSVSVTRLFGNLGVDIPVSTDGTLNFRIGSEYETYDFKDSPAFAPGWSEPWDRVLRHRLDAGYSQPAGDKWRWFVGADVQSAGEIGADWNKTLTFGGRAGASYALSNTLILGGGLFVHTRLEDDPAIFPFAFVRWQFADKWSLSTTGRNPASFGIGLELSYQFAEDWTVFLAGSYQSRDFRLDDDGASPGGIGQQRQVPINFGVAWKANSQVSLTAYLGANLFQEYELQDASGNELQQFDAEISPFIGLQAEFKF